ncbi:four-carbon acid sugar kinase family protein [Rothia koreensis]|uniref:four-carbon acid sugar kinase family protein n=1 Tax=Rothia koreensis TaxID=592378 RepID=UPI003FCD52D7
MVEWGEVVRILALADDLSGASEVAAILAEIPECTQKREELQPRQRGVCVHLEMPTLGAKATEVTVLDTDNRRRGEERAADHLRHLLNDSAVSPGPQVRVFLKFDSLLRGHIGGQLRAAQELTPVLFCPAVPGIGRTVRGGKLLIDGYPLRDSGLWSAEPEYPANEVASQLSPAPTRTLDLTTVRGTHLGKALKQAAESGAVAVCDAESEADLDRLAAIGLDLGFTLAGAAGLAEATARRLASESFAPPAGAVPDRRDTLFILGTASAAAQRQVDRLEETGIRVHRLHPEQIDGFSLEHHGTVAVTVDGPVDPSNSESIITGLAHLAMRHHADRHLVLSGGETARTVLGVLGFSELVPLKQAHAGAVVSEADGRLIATRPGSYGPPTSLIDILTTIDLLQNTTRKA